MKIKKFKDFVNEAVNVSRYMKKPEIAEYAIDSKLAEQYIFRYNRLNQIETRLDWPDGELEAQYWDEMSDKTVAQKRAELEEEVVRLRSEFERIKSEIFRSYPYAEEVEKHLRNLNLGLNFGSTQLKKINKSGSEINSIVVVGYIDGIVKIDSRELEKYNVTLEQYAAVLLSFALAKQY